LQSRLIASTLCQSLASTWDIASDDKKPNLLSKFVIAPFVVIARERAIVVWLTIPAINTKLHAVDCAGSQG